MTEFPHLAFQTNYSRTGKLSLHNRKPYRTKAQKLVAQKTAGKCSDGAFRSNAPVSFHPAPRGEQSGG